MKKSLKKLQHIQITEKQRTLVLVVLLVIALGFIYWTKNSYDANFVDGF